MPIRGIAEIQQRALRVRLLLMDCDGVLTDGRITLGGGGEEEKHFHTRDGHGLVLLHSAGLESGIVSGRRSKVVEERARELGIKYVRQGSVDKVVEFEELLRNAGVSADEVAYVGDDLTDIPLLQRACLGIAVADAADEVRAIADHITRLPGGFGAVREACELILKAQGKWDEVIRRYYV